MDKSICKVKECATENDETAGLVYYLTVEESLSNDYNAVYGIEVEKIQNNEYETECVKGISYDRNKVLEIIRKIAEALVTPVTLVNIIDDIIE